LILNYFGCGYWWQVARASAFTFGLAYGSVKLKYLRVFSSPFEFFYF